MIRKGMDADEFTRHYGKVRRRVEQFFPRASALDVVQQAYAETLRYSRRSTRPIDNPLALFWRIASRVAQRPAYRSVYVPSRAERNVRSPPENAEPWAEASAREEEHLLGRALDRLELRQREAVQGLYFDERGCEELAREACVGRSAIKSRLQRARANLKDAMRGNAP